MDLTMEILNDRHQVFNPYQASCSHCSQEFNSIDFTCRAFPGGIPDDILSGDNNQEAPVPDQGNEVIYSARK